MKTILEHIDYVKEQPHHIRKRVAFGAAGTLTALVALVWFAGSLATGAFALKGTSFATSVGQAATVATTSAFGNQNLAGAAAAVVDKNAPAHIEIVDTTPAPAVKSQAEQTVLPF